MQLVKAETLASLSLVSMQIVVCMYTCVFVMCAVVVLCASADVVRKIMLKAAELHFDNGEYVFINIDLFSTSVSLLSLFTPARGIICSSSSVSQLVCPQCYYRSSRLCIRRSDSHCRIIFAIRLPDRTSFNEN